MKVAIECQNCHRRYAVAETSVGKKVKCQGCGTIFVATAAEKAQVATASRPASAARPTPPPPRLEPEVDPFDAMASLEQPSAGALPIPPAPASPYSGGWAHVPAPAAAAPAYGIHPPAIPYSKPSGPRSAEVSEMQVMVSRLLLVAYVGGMAYVIYKFFDHEVPQSTPSELVSLVHRFQWAFILSRVLLVAAITAPLLLAAEWLAGMLMKFRTADNNYLRAAGIAGLVEAGLLSMVAFNPDSNTTRYLLIVLIAAAAAAAIWYTYGLKPIEAAATVGLSAVAFVAAWFVVSPVQIAITTSGIVPLKTTIKGEPFVLPVEGLKDRPAFVLLLSDDEERIRLRLKEKEEERGKRSSSPNYAFSSPASPRGGGQGNPSATAPDTPRFKSQLADFVKEKESGRLSREAARKKLDELQSAMNRESTAHSELSGRDPDWSDLQTALMLERSKINRELPSEEPDPTVHISISRPTEQFMPDPAILATLSANEDVIGDYRIRLPANVQAGTGNGQTDAQGATRWSWEVPGATLTITIMPSRGGQGQAWVMTHEFMRNAAQAQSLYAIEAFDGKATKRTGHLNGNGMLRVDHAAPGLVPAWIEYAGKNRKSQWVILRATSPTGDAAAMKTLDTAIATFRKDPAASIAVSPVSPGVVSTPGNVQRPQTPAPATPPVAAAKPLTASEVANIITTDYFNSKETLRRHGPRAEAGIVECLTSSDPRVKRVAVELLPDVATAASIEKLKSLTSSQDRDVAKAVQTVLQKLAAAQFDAISAALAEIKSNDTFRRRDAIRKLADIPPDDARRDEVNAFLEGFVLDAQFGNWDGDEAAKALANRATSKTATKLVPVLNNPKLDSWQRKRLIKSLSGCHESRLAAAMVMKWMALEPDEVTASLSKMGPIAEDETIRILNANFSGKDAAAQSVRSHCVQILTAIGTAKSFEVLGRVSRDPRDPIAQAVAKDAIETIKARAAANPATKPTAPPAK